MIGKVNVNVKNFGSWEQSRPLALSTKPVKDFFNRPLSFLPIPLSILMPPNPQIMQVAVCYRGPKRLEDMLLFNGASLLLIVI